MSDGNEQRPQQVRLEPGLLDLQQTADYLQTSTRSVRRRTAEGTLPGSRKMGSQVRWSRKVLELWILCGCPHDATEFELIIRQQVVQSGQQ